MNIKISKISPYDYNSIRCIYESLSDLENEYPDFKNWYFNIVVKNMVSNERSLFIAKDISNDQYAGVMILKNSACEKKICTLRVFDDYQGYHIGSEFIKKAFQVLHTSAPLITVSEKHILQFRKILNKFRFKEMAIYPSYYKQGLKEYTFNGFLPLTPRKTAINE